MFSKICREIHKSRCITGINDTSGNASSTTQRCPKEIMKIFLIENFFHFPPVSTTSVVNLELRISPRILEKIWNGPNGIRGLGETDPWQKPEVKKSSGFGPAPDTQTLPVRRCSRAALLWALGSGAAWDTPASGRTSCAAVSAHGLLFAQPGRKNVNLVVFQCFGSGFALFLVG